MKSFVAIWTVTVLASAVSPASAQPRARIDAERATKIYRAGWEAFQREAFQREEA